MTYTFKLSRRLAVVFLFALVAAALVALGLLLGSSLDSTRYIPLLGAWLGALLQTRPATWAFYLIIVAIGCASGRVFPFQREFAGAREFLEHMFPGRSLQFYELADFFLSCTRVGVGHAHRSTEKCPYGTRNRPGVAIHHPVPARGNKSDRASAGERRRHR
jgi:hypothetical protein